MPMLPKPKPLLSSSRRLSIGGGCREALAMSLKTWRSHVPERSPLATIELTLRFVVLSSAVMLPSVLIMLACGATGVVAPVPACEDLRRDAMPEVDGVFLFFMALNGD